MPRMRNRALYLSGLALGALNTVRHKRQGYVNPRSFDPTDVQQTIHHAILVVDRLQERGRVDWQDKRVLEIGPGNDLTTGAIMLDRGAASYLAVDLFDNLAQASGEIYDRLGHALGKPIDVARLGFQQVSFPDLPQVSGEFDLIVSNATFEHISDVGNVFARLHALAAERGRMVHHIDAKAHMRWFRDHDPLNPLRYSDIVYRNVLSFPGAPNRLRSHEYASLAEQVGWRPEIVPGRRADADYLRDIKVARRFRGYPDLNLLSFTLVAEAR
jgi:hypothetical protein